MSKTIYFHSKTTPRVCVCGMLNEEGTELSIGVARCSRKSHYVKKEGRKLAEHRAVNEPLSVIKLTSVKDLSKQFVPLAEGYSKIVSVDPKRVHPILLTK